MNATTRPTHPRGPHQNADRECATKKPSTHPITPTDQIDAEREHEEAAEDRDDRLMHGVFLSNYRGSRYQAMIQNGAANAVPIQTSPIVTVSCTA
jgi:hypothetical protein